MQEGPEFLKSRAICLEKWLHSLMISYDDLWCVSVEPWFDNDNDIQAVIPMLKILAATFPVRPAPMMPTSHSAVWQLPQDTTRRNKPPTEILQRLAKIWLHWKRWVQFALRILGKVVTERRKCRHNPSTMRSKHNPSQSSCRSRCSQNNFFNGETQV